ncbi:FUSC family protein [Tunturiibacter lichenicola]|uniref:FUSC family protein n=1 Tax=Tunturiibacter lichenicola TaxID=2051959 RepID=UPI0021B2AE9C|nr:FUSC family protein [Edaphobacter lichenicola]
MMTVVAGGTLAIIIAAIASTSLPVAVVVTSLFCFSVTLARVVSQPLASGSASILICYFVSYGAAVHTPASVRSAILYFIAGGIWAAAFSLVFWPLDPFGPARNAVADIYAKLAGLPALPLEDSARFKDSVHQIRVLIEAAQGSLIAVPARMTARTVRARNLTVIVQAADLLFARLFRLAELGAHESMSEPELCQSAVKEVAEWLAASLKPIEAALRERPYDNAAAFVLEGSLIIEMRRGAKHIDTKTIANNSDGISTQLKAQLVAVERDCLLSLEVIYESIRALWTGVEPTTTGLRSIFSKPAPSSSSPQIWLETLRSNFTSRSIMFRHALRLGLVAAADLLLLRLIHITHSYWMPMTSIIVLQPYTGETWRKSGDRVAGTVSGAILAAGLAATMPSEAGIEAAGSPAAVPTIAAARGVFQRANENGLGNRNMTSVVLDFIEWPG